jgi:phospholipid/cholesterol/gamma-HCH transport system substrate-binding protein
MSHRRQRLAIVVAATTAVLLSGCEFDGAYDLPLPGSPVDEDSSFVVTAEFQDVLNVVPRSVVMVDDVTVGEVIEVDRVGWHAEVMMRIDDGTVLPDNAVADIRQTSLLGEKYVALEDPVTDQPDGRLSEGDSIPLSATGRNPEVEEVLGALSFLLSGGGVGQLATITDELNQVMSGREGRLRHLLGSLEDVVGTLDAQKTDIIQAMESMNNLASTLNAEKETIGEALDVMGPAVGILADQHTELMRMLGALDRLGVVGTRVIGASKDDILASLRHLKPVLTQLNETGDKLAPGLALLVSFPFPKEASEVVQGDYANTFIKADISLENFLTGGGGGSPLPPIPPINPGQILGQIQKCLATGDLTSRKCRKVLADADLLGKLVKVCKKKRNRDNAVCRALNALPGGGGGPGLPDLPDLPGLPGLSGLARLNEALSSGFASPTASGAGLYAGGQA